MRVYLPGREALTNRYRVAAVYTTVLQQGFDYLWQDLSDGWHDTISTIFLSYMNFAELSTPQERCENVDTYT
jgi:hypothetical protein